MTWILTQILACVLQEKEQSRANAHVAYHVNCGILVSIKYNCYEIITLYTISVFMINIKVISEV